jgi:hypothetical protein
LSSIALPTTPVRLSGKLALGIDDAPLHNGLKLLTCPYPDPFKTVDLSLFRPFHSRIFGADVGMSEKVLSDTFPTRNYQPSCCLVFIHQWHHESAPEDFFVAFR